MLGLRQAPPERSVRVVADTCHGESPDFNEDQAPFVRQHLANVLPAGRRRVCSRKTGGAALSISGLAVTALYMGSAAMRKSLVGGVQGLQEHKSSVCSALGEDCTTTKCCQHGGQTCFEKTEYWAMCMDSCMPGHSLPGDDNTDPWSCKTLGDRAKFEVGCAWAGEDCSTTKRCCQRGYQCLMKNEYWSACTQVEVGPWNSSVPQSTKLVPEGWDGTNLGGWRSEFEVYGVPKEYAASSTLFCFMAVLPDSAETVLVDLARQRKASVFGCEGHRIFDSTQSKFQMWGTGHSTLVNTETFVKIWDLVREDGQYLFQDWTVKVDADAIFFPARLRSHLEALSAPAYTPVYVKNCPAKFTLGGWLGAIEIFSKTAAETYLDNADSCVKHIGLNSGEDGFLKDCMDSLGVGYMHDELILHPSPATSDCQVKEFAAYHPIKSPSNWTVCYDLAAGNEKSKYGLHPSAVGELPESIRHIYAGSWTGDLV